MSDRHDPLEPQLEEADGSPPAWNDARRVPPHQRLHRPAGAVAYPGVTRWRAGRETRMMTAQPDANTPTEAHALAAALGERLAVARLDHCPAPTLRDGTTFADLAHLTLDFTGRRTAPGIAVGVGVNLYADRAWPCYQVETADGDEAGPIERVEYGDPLPFTDHAGPAALVAAILAALDDAPGAAAADGWHTCQFCARAFSEYVDHLCSATPQAPAGFTVVSDYPAPDIQVVCDRCGHSSRFKDESALRAALATGCRTCHGAAPGDQRRTRGACARGHILVPPHLARG